MLNTMKKYDELWFIVFRYKASLSSNLASIISSTSILTACSASDLITWEIVFNTLNPKHCHCRQYFIWNLISCRNAIGCLNPGCRSFFTNFVYASYLVGLKFPTFNFQAIVLTGHKVWLQWIPKPASYSWCLVNQGNIDTREIIDQAK